MYKINVNKTKCYFYKPPECNITISGSQGLFKPGYSKQYFLPQLCSQEKITNNRFPFLDILGYLKNTHKNPKFGRVRQVPTRELGWEFRGWDLSHCAKFGIFMGIL